MIPYEYVEPPPTHYECVVPAVHSSSHPPLFLLAGNKQKFGEQVKSYALDCMNQLEGWCSELKATTLIDLILKAKPNIIVEIGVWGGKSLVPMACALKALNKGTIYGIDPWTNDASVEEVMQEENKAFWSYVDHDGVFRHLIGKIHQFELQDHIVLIKSSSEEAPEIQGIDLLHVDGNHSTKKSYLDVTKWVPLMNSGGWIIFDDMTWCEKGVFTTAKAVEWLDEHCIKIAQFSDIYCVWGLWVKP